MRQGHAMGTIPGEAVAHAESRIAAAQELRQFDALQLRELRESRTES
jgi:hypothetical protein